MSMAAIPDHDAPPEALPSAAGRVLGPGDHLVEIRLRPPLPEGASEEAVTAALVKLGFEGVVLDQVPDAGERSLVRFVGTLKAHGLDLRDTQAISWERIHTLAIEPWHVARESALVELVPGQRYEVLLRSWQHKGRAEVATDLERMGFHVDVLVAIQRNMRLPDRAGALFKIWVGVLTYEEGRARGVLTSDEPFFFDACVALGKES